MVTPISFEDHKLLWKEQFPVTGKGVMVFNIQRIKPFAIVVGEKVVGEEEEVVGEVVVVEENTTNSWLSLEVHSGLVAFCMKRKTQENFEVLKTIKKTDIGIHADRIVPYWLSYDPDRMTLKYGKGYRMKETTLMSYDFYTTKPEEIDSIREEFFNAVKVLDVKCVEKKDLAYVRSARMHSMENMVEFDPNPFVGNFPPKILDSSKVTLQILDEGYFTFSSSLPPKCRELYENVLRCDLNWSEGSDKCLLSDAIRYSINTEGCILNEKIKEKEEEKKQEKESEKQVYLRITLGHTFGNSPGIPYVLEIWPAGNESPIHDHGNACAVIKLLFGSLKISIYNKQIESEDENPLQTFDVREGDITWIDKNWYQTHKLQNTTNDFSATIQCYGYSDNDTMHWPNFNYVTESSTISEFVPDSDFRFNEMKVKVIDEFNGRPNRPTDEYNRRPNRPTDKSNRKSKRPKLS